MSDREKINLTVNRLRRTRRWQVVLDYLIVGLFWGAIPAGLAILASRIWVLPVNEYILGAALLGAVATGFVIGSFFVRLTPLEVANDIDVTLGLRERVSSALALGEGKTAADPFVVTLVHDAAKQVEGLPLKKVYPWTLPPAWKLALPALLIAAALVFMPQLNLFASEEDRQEIKLIQDKGKELLELAKKAEEEPEERKDPVVKKQIEEIKRVGEKLERGNVKKKEALKELQRLKEKLEAQAQTQMTDGEKQLIAELGEQLSKLDTTGEMGKMLIEGDLKGLMSKLGELAANLQEGKLTPGDQALMEDLMKALDEALQSEAANSSEAQAMKQAMEELKEALKNDQQLREQMQSELNSLEQDVNELSEQLQQNGMNQPSEQLDQLMQQMQQQMEQNGMVNPSTLEQMKQALEQAQQSIQNNPSLGQQQQQQMSEQAQKCLDHFQQKESG